MTAPTPDTSPQLSKCHQAPVELSGGVGDFSDSDRVMTMHYVCTECKQPCDLYVPDTSPGDEQSESHLTVIKDGKVIKEQTQCHCGLIHLPPMTHELHAILVKEYETASNCDHCIYSRYSPHDGVATALNRLMLTRERERLESVLKPEYRTSFELEGDKLVTLIDPAFIYEAIAEIDAQLNKEETDGDSK